MLAWLKYAFTHDSYLIGRKLEIWCVPCMHSVCNLTRLGYHSAHNALHQANNFDRNSPRNDNIIFWWHLYRENYSYMYQRENYVAISNLKVWMRNKHGISFSLDCRYFMVHCHFKNDFVSQVVLAVILLATHWFYSIIEVHVMVLTVIISMCIYWV